MAYFVLLLQLAILFAVGFYAPTKLGVARFKKTGTASWWIYLIFFFVAWAVQAVLGALTIQFIRQLPSIVNVLPDFGVFVFPIAAFCYRKKACEKA